KRLRRLTIDEAIILQTFPDDYIFIGPQSKVFSQIGNAVPCKLAQVVAEVVKSKLSKKTDYQENDSTRQLPLEII
ncbi:DNA cytosine methyltransferase, partial [Providencia manganoxydans]